MGRNVTVGLPSPRVVPVVNVRYSRHRYDIAYGVKGIAKLNQRTILDTILIRSDSYSSAAPSIYYNPHYTPLPCMTTMLVTSVAASRYVEARPTIRIRRFLIHNNIFRIFLIRNDLTSGEADPSITDSASRPLSNLSILRPLSLSRYLTLLLTGFSPQDEDEKRNNTRRMRTGATTNR